VKEARRSGSWAHCPCRRGQASEKCVKEQLLGTPLVLVAAAPAGWGQVKKVREVKEVKEVKKARRSG
jgi:hypothetical protein